MGMINIRWSVAQAGDETSNGQPSVKRLLLIKLRYLGDVVLSTPVLPPLRKQFPDAKITFLVNPGTVAVLQGNPYLDEVWVLPRQSWWQQLRFFQRAARGFCLSVATSTTIHCCALSRTTYMQPCPSSTP